MTERRAVLVMAYGTPHDLGGVEAYYTDIRGGRPPPPELLDDLIARYRAIGGSPLRAITNAQVRGIEQRAGVPCHLGQKHAEPFIPDAVEQLARDEVERAVGLVLAPHYSAVSIGDYEARARRAAGEIGWDGDLRMVESWHLEAGYIDFLTAAVGRAFSSLSERAQAGAVVIFTAHSLPARAVRAGDPYRRQLTETADAVARRAGLDRWQIGWQSAGRTADPWLGPDVTESLTELSGKGVPGIVVCPCGFVADHLEVLYDIDIEARAVAEKQSIELARTDMPNDDPNFLDTLVRVVERAFR